MRKPLLFAVTALLVACGTGRAADADDKLVQELVALFKDPKNKPDVRSTAIRALAPLGWTGRTALPDLIKLLNDAEERKAARETIGPYYYAITAIGRMGSGAREAAPTLIKAKGIAAPYDLAIDGALENLLQPPSATLGGLLSALRDNDSSLRLMAAKALRDYPGEYSVVEPFLRAAEKDPDPDVRRVAEESARTITRAEVARLAALLKDRDENVRMLAAKALGRLGAAAAPAVPALTEAAQKDADADVRAVAKNALDKIKAKPTTGA